MKRLIALALVAAFVLGGAFNASAAEFKVKGEFKFSFAAIWNGDLNSRHGWTQENVFSASQRVRVEMSYVASENLKGVWHIELGETQWGQRASGGDLSADRIIVETKHAYIAFNVPNTELTFKVGIQGLALPMAVGGSSFVFDDDVAAVVAAYKFNDMISLVAFWARPYDANQRGTISWAGSTINPAYDTMDAWGIVLPLKGDGWSITPYAMIGRAGMDSIAQWSGPAVAVSSLYVPPAGTYIPPAAAIMNSALNGSWYNLANQGDRLSLGLLSPFARAALQNAGTAQYAYSTFVRQQHNLIAWWAGGAFSLSMFEPFTFSADVLYGAVEADAKALNRKGWYLAASIDYKMDLFTPSIFGWWATGENKNWKDGSEEIPFFANSVGWGVDSFAMDQINTSDLLSNAGAGPILDGPVGKWGIGFALKDISFIKDLTSQLRFIYARGTNDPAANYYFLGGIGPWSNVRMLTYGANYTGSSNTNNFTMTTRDWLFEVNFDHKYMIYENLALVLELGYVHMERAKWALYDASFISNPAALAAGINRAPLISRGPSPSEDAFKAALGLVYKF